MARFQISNLQQQRKGETPGAVTPGAFTPAPAPAPSHPRPASPGPGPSAAKRHKTESARDSPAGRGDTGTVDLGLGGLALGGGVHVHVTAAGRRELIESQIASYPELMDPELTYQNLCSRSGEDGSGGAGRAAHASVEDSLRLAVSFHLRYAEVSEHRFEEMVQNVMKLMKDIGDLRIAEAADMGDDMH